MGNELVNAERFIYGRLTGREPLNTMIDGRAWPENAPAGTAYPLVVYRYSTAENTVQAIGHIRKALPLLYVVFATMETDNFAGELEILASEIDQALSGKQAIAGDGYVYSAVRRNPWRDIEYPGNRERRSLGWYFRILISAAPVDV